MAEDDTEDNKDKIAQSTTPVPTNAGIVVAWIGIVFSVIIAGVYCISAVYEVVLMCMDLYDGEGTSLFHFLTGFGQAILLIVPVACIVCIYTFMCLVYARKWTSGACVIAVIATLIVGCFLAGIIDLAETAVSNAIIEGLSSSEDWFWKALGSLFVTNILSVSGAVAVINMVFGAFLVGVPIFIIIFAAVMLVTESYWWNRLVSSDSR